MDGIFHLLEKHRLETYYNHFLQLGVKDERDFLDSVTEEDLTNLGKITKQLLNYFLYKFHKKNIYCKSGCCPLTWMEWLEAIDC